MDGVLTPLLAGFVALLLLVAIGYTLVTTRAVVVLAGRRLARRWRRSRGLDQHASQEWLYRERESATSSATASAGREARGRGDTVASAERAAEEITERARREARTVLREAELRAKEVLADAERESSLLRQQLADERRQLSSLLHSVLEEVNRGSVAENAEVRDLAQARELRDRSEASE